MRQHGIKLLTATGGILDGRRELPIDGFLTYAASQGNGLVDRDWYPPLSKVKKHLDELILGGSRSSHMLDVFDAALTAGTDAKPGIPRLGQSPRGQQPLSPLAGPKAFPGEK